MGALDDIPAAARAATGKSGKPPLPAADRQIWELYGLIVAAILSTAMILLGNQAPVSLWLLLVLAAAIGQALLLPSAAASFGALGTLLAWVLLRQAAGAWRQANVVQIALELLGLSLSLFLAVRARRSREKQRQEMIELRALRQVLVAAEPGTGLLSLDVAELRLAEEIDRARQFRRPLGLLIAEIQPLPGHRDSAEFGDVCQAITRQLASAALVHDIPYRVDDQQVALLMPERDWEKLYADAGLIVQALRRATYLAADGHFRPVAYAAQLSVGLGTYQGEAADDIDLVRAAQDSLAISRDLADIGQAPVTAYAMPAVPIVESHLPAAGEGE